MHAVGLRLVSTDSTRLLTTWIPAAGFLPEEQPGLGEMPDVGTAVAYDQYGRARGLLAYLGQQAAKEENDGLKALVHLGVPWQAVGEPSGELQLDGFDAEAVDLEYPDHERLQLPVFEGSYPNWRTVLTSFVGAKTAALAVRQDNLAVVAKAAGYFGEFAPLQLRFGGEQKAIAVEFGDEPRVYGLLMPLQWDFDTDAPVEPVEP